LGEKQLEWKITEEMLKAILNTIDEGIHVVDADGVTIFYNQVAAAHDNLSVDEVIGRPILEVFPSLNKETSTLLKVIETGQAIVNQQQTYTNLKGERVTTVNTTLPLWINGKLCGAVEIAKDITKVRELSEKLIDLQARFHVKAKEKAFISESQAKYHLHDIITINPHMMRLKETAAKVARTHSPILVTGETGTGKELFVQGIHNSSPRKKGPFIAQNCAALPDTLLEGILFGTVKGSFTGAENRPGLFELANGGTLFLDEINSMPSDLQAKLLRVLQEGMIRRVGGTKMIPVDVRVIAAMNTSPQEALERGELRSDLYYRIQVVHLDVPPLRERKEDIPILIDHFIKKFNFLFSTLVTRVEESVMVKLLAYSWPGNVRELENTIESAMNLVEGDTLLAEHFPTRIFGNRNFGNMQNVPWEQDQLDLRMILSETENRLILEAMNRTGGNLQQAANLLGIPRQTLQYKLKKLQKGNRETRE
jgi:arginine utilization regulatory protein